MIGGRLHLGGPDISDGTVLYPGIIGCTTQEGIGTSNVVSARAHPA